MITLPFYFLLILYAIFLIIFFTFFIINFGHLIATGTNTLGSFIITFTIIALSVLTLFGTWYYLQGTDWQQSITVLNFEFITNLFQSGNGQYF